MTDKHESGVEHLVMVQAKSRPYPVVIGGGLLNGLGGLLNEAGLSGRALVITDKRVAGLHLERFLAGVEGAGVRVAGVMILGRGESRKSLTTVRRVYKTLVTGRFNRDDLIINLSGGMLGDLSGFAAATYMRGMRWVQVPTTMLAQVDASVGGKVGVNLPAGKNLVGSFYQPWMVVCDTDTVMTLSNRAFRSGLAEVVKMAMAFDGSFFRYLCEHARDILERRPAVLAEVVKRSVTLKANVVVRDEREGGFRMTLNYGHTLAHALEKAAGYRSFTHGEAVSLGMCAAAQLAKSLGMIKNGLIECQRELLAAFGLPVALSKARRDRVCIDEVMEAVAVDKKQRRKGLCLVLPKRVGAVEIITGVSNKKVRRVFRRFLERG